MIDESSIPASKIEVSLAMGDSILHSVLSPMARY
jgi:hypothetical protein